MRSNCASAGSVFSSDGSAVGLPKMLIATDAWQKLLSSGHKEGVSYGHFSRISQYLCARVRARRWVNHGSAAADCLFFGRSLRPL